MKENWFLSKKLAAQLNDLNETKIRGPSRKMLPAILLRRRPNLRIHTTTETNNVTLMRARESEHSRQLNLHTFFSSPSTPLRQTGSRRRLLYSCFLEEQSREREREKEQRF